MKKVLALILSVLLLVAGLPFAAFAADDTAGAVQELGGKYYSLGNVLYQNNFEGETLDTMPEGWQAGRPSYGWVGYGGSAAATVKENNGGKRLWVAIGSVDGFVSTPVINTRNYMFEADLTMSDGYMGIVNNMAGGVEASTTCIISRVFHSTATGTNETYHKGAVSIPTTAFTIPSGNPVKGEAVKVKLISFEGTSYLYFNGDLVNTYSNVLPENTTDCVGFYGCNSWYGVDNVKITALNVEEAPIVGFDYADVLNVEIGEKIFRHDYSSMTALPAEITGSASLSNGPDGEKTLCFGNYWNSDGRNAKINVGTQNFAAKVTMVVDNVQTNKIGGTFAFRTLGKNTNDAEAIASYIRFGLPDRTAGVPNPGDVIYYNEGAQYDFTNVSGVTPFTADSGIETFTFYVYSLNGVNYYVKEDNTLIATSAHKTGVTNANVVEMFCEYGIVYVTDFEVFSISKKQPNSHLYVDALEQTTGFVRGEELVGVDFVDSAAGTTPDGWTLTSSSIGAGSDKTANRNVLRLANDGGASKTTIPVSTSNFVAVATIGMDYAKKLSGTFWFGVSDTSNVIAAQWGLGLPKRSESQTLKAGKSVVTNTVGYAYPAAGNYEFSTEGYTTVKMIIYSYNGQLHCYWADGTFVYSIAMNEAANINGGACKIHFANDYATAYVHDISVYSITPYGLTLDSELVEGSGFIADKPYYDMDFETATAGSTPEGWTFSASSIGAGSADTANRNVLRLNNDSGYSNARFAVPFKNFAATITVGMDYAKRLNGSLVFGVKNADDVLAATWSIGLPKRSEAQTLKAGKSVITKGSGTYDYIYPAAGDYTFSTSGYTTVKMVMYLYNGVFYFFWEDGTLVGSVAANSACDLSKDLHIYLGNDWGTAYIHDIKVYEIIPNSFKVNSATLGIDNNKTVVNFGISYDDSLKNVVSSDDMEFGAVVTVNDNAVATDTTVNTKGATIWEFEKGTAINDIYNFSKQYVVTNDIADKYINIRLFVKTEEMYSYADAVSYCPAQLADVFYRSTQDSNVKAIIDRTFASSNIFLGKESRKTTFTVFSDFHYVEGMYISSIKDMNTIFDRANASGSSFVLSAGDMCNDIKGSPELINALLNNKYGLTAANVYGNHELEGPNSMEIVTPTLTNAQGVVWGTADGSYNENIAYYYFEKDGFRIICTDTNYSWDPTNQIWEHNTTWSYGPPAGNTNINALGPVQLEWLQKVLNDAAAKDIPCILMGHASLHGGFGEQSYDASKVMEMCVEANKANPNTVMMLISGHSHDDRIEKINGIVCFRVNTTRNGYWKAAGTDHYTENDTFMMETYDEQGNFLGYVEKKIGELSGGKNTHFTKEALSATVTIDECGIITIEGMGATWMNGVEPDLSGVSQYIRPQISNYSSFNCEDGHIWDYKIDEFGNFVYDECLNPECGVAIVGGKETYKVSDFVYDNESYKVNFNYSANSAVKLGFFVADKENANTINYIEGENKAIFTANGSGSAEILLTVDKKGGLGNGVGNELYMYVIDGNALDIKISDITALKLTNANGGSVITNKGVSILTDVAENKTQAMRYYFSYDTTTGSDLVIDGKSYTIKSRGFLFANGDVLGEETVTRESAKNGNVIDMNISKNFANCWKAVQNNDAAQTTNLWFSTYVTGFAPENGTYNNTNRLYVKGYVVVEINGVEFTLYGEEVNATVSDVAALVK